MRPGVGGWLYCSYPCSELEARGVLEELAAPGGCRGMPLSRGRDAREQTQKLGTARRRRPVPWFALLTVQSDADQRLRIRLGALPTVHLSGTSAPDLVATGSISFYMPPTITILCSTVH